LEKKVSTTASKAPVELKLLHSACMSFLVLRQMPDRDSRRLRGVRCNLAERVEERQAGSGTTWEVEGRTDQVLSGFRE
jgi:hypothetical protein